MPVSPGSRGDASAGDVSRLAGGIVDLWAAAWIFLPYFWPERGGALVGAGHLAERLSCFAAIRAFEIGAAICRLDCTVSLDGRGIFSKRTLLPSLHLAKW